MSAVPKRQLTHAEYLAIEREADFKSEFFNGEMFAMAGAKYPHNRAKDNLARWVGNQLEGSPCHALTSDMRIKVERTGLIAYPDIVIICDQPEFEDEVQDVLLNPRTLIEILSDSTESYDRGKKFRNYQQIDSLAEYVLVAQDEPHCECYTRQADGTWLLRTFSGLEANLEFSSIPVVVPLKAIYAGVTFIEKKLPPEIGYYDKKPAKPAP